MQFATPTPIEEHTVETPTGPLTFAVKREDLQAGDAPGWPRWGKMAQVQAMLTSRVDELRAKGLGHFTGTYSFSGWCLARLCKELHIPLTLYYPESLATVPRPGRPIRTIFPSVFKEYFQTHEVSMEPVVWTQPDVMAKWALSKSKAAGLVPNKIGFNWPEYMRACRGRVGPDTRPYDVLIVTAGSGISSVSVAAAFLEAAPMRRRQAIMYGTGLARSIDFLISQASSRIEHVKTEYERDFDNARDDVVCPFDINEIWDKKAYAWMLANQQRFVGKRVLFWNLGGSYREGLQRLEDCRSNWHDH